MNKVPPAHRAQALGFRALSRLRGETVKYYINATTFVEIANAILTRPKAKADQVGSVMILAHHWDWLIAPDALENGDGQIIPQRGIGLFVPAMEHVTTSNRTMAKNNVGVGAMDPIPIAESIPASEHDARHCPSTIARHNTECSY